MTFKDAKPNKNWVLPTALVKKYFGDFQIKERWNLDNCGAGMEKCEHRKKKYANYW